MTLPTHHWNRSTTSFTNSQPPSFNPRKPRLTSEQRSARPQKPRLTRSPQATEKDGGLHNTFPQNRSSVLHLNQNLLHIPRTAFKETFDGERFDAGTFAHALEALGLPADTPPEELPGRALLECLNALHQRDARIVNTLTKKQQKLDWYAQCHQTRRDPRGRKKGTKLKRRKSVKT